MRVLKFNQKQAVEKLSKFKVGALFMQAGSGKTLTCTTIINSRDDIDFVLWFTPFRTKENLRIELELCNLKYPVEIIGIESLSNSDRLYLELLNKYKDKKYFCVLDESLKIKNNSVRYKRITDIAKNAKYKLILNGTPISKNYLDLYNQFDFLSPKILNMSFNQFYNTFVVEKQLYKGHKLKKKWVDSFDNLEYLFNMISPFIYESDLQLDVPIYRENINYLLDNETLTKYYNVKNRLLKRIENFQNILPTLQELQHSYSITDSKIRAIKNIIKELKLKGIPENEILIFYKYLDEKEMLKKEFPKIKVLSFMKHTFGLNLQDNNVIIFSNMSWDYAVMEQAEKRIFRLGQNKKCYIYTLKSNAGLDDMISNNIKKKTNLLQEFKNKTIKELEDVI